MGECTFRSNDLKPYFTESFIKYYSNITEILQIKLLIKNGTNSFLDLWGML